MYQNKCQKHVFHEYRQISPTFLRLQWSKTLKYSRSFLACCFQLSMQRWRRHFHHKDNPFLMLFPILLILSQSPSIPCHLRDGRQKATVRCNRCSNQGKNVAKRPLRVMTFHWWLLRTWLTSLLWRSSSLGNQTLPGFKEIPVKNKAELNRAVTDYVTWQRKRKCAQYPSALHVIIHGQRSATGTKFRVKEPLLVKTCSVRWEGN